MDLGLAHDFPDRNNAHGDGAAAQGSARNGNVRRLDRDHRVGRAVPSRPTSRGGQDLHEPVGVHLAGVSGMGDDEQEAAQLSCGRADFGFCQGSVPV